MKDLVLVAVNAKYIHTNLALRYLRETLNHLDVEFLEMSINDSLNRIISHLLKSKTLIYGFSSYIWNIDLILKITELLKRARPEALIILGGPEVSFDSEKFLKRHSFIDCVVTGSGELKLPLLMDALKANRLIAIEGIYFSDQLKEKFSKSSKVSINQKIEMNQVNDLSVIAFPSPYRIDELSALKNRIIYYETIRGCPYRCSYCLSSLETELLLKPLETVFAEIDVFFKAGVKQVKLVDRTFNCQPKRAIRIFKYIIEKAKENYGSDLRPNFHFEMTGDQISSEMIQCLSKAPKGLIQFEIGVQTTCEKTLKAIDRPINFEKTKTHVRELLKAKNIHIHLDLIAGLPYENFEIFEKSFNQVVALQPDMLQLGFLKGLKGTKIRNQAIKHDYEFSSFAPYEIIRNAYLTAEELYLLKDMEILVDRFYNSGFFSTTIKRLFFSKNKINPFIFFKNFAKWWGAKGYFDIGISKESLYNYLYHFLNDCNFSFARLLFDCLVYDYYDHNRLKEPGFCKVQALAKEAIFDFLKDDKKRDLYLSEFSHWAPKKIYPQIKIIKLSCEFYQVFYPEEFIKTQLNKDQQPYLLLTKQRSHKLILINNP